MGTLCLPFSNLKGVYNVYTLAKATNIVCHLCKIRISQGMRQSHTLPITQGGIVMEKQRVKMIYKYSLFVELVRLNNNFLYSARNRENKKYQVYAFEQTEKLDRDI